MMITPLILLILAAAPLQPPVMLMNDEGAVFGDSWVLAGTSTVVLSQSGSESRFQSPVCLEVDSPDAGSLPGECSVYLVNGEIYSGVLSPSNDADALCLKSRTWGDLCFPLDEVVKLNLSGPGQGMSASCAPCLILANGDTLPGDIKGISPDAVSVASPFGEIPTEISRLSAVLLRQSALPFDGREGDTFLIEKTDGQKWYLDVVEGTQSNDVKVTRGTATASIPVSSIRRLIFRGWKAALLTDIGRASIETTPYLDETVLLDVDAPGAPKSRLVGNRSIAGGFTASPRSTASWALPENAGFLTGRVAQSPLAGPDNNATVRIESGSDILWKDDSLTKKAGSVHFAVRMKSAREITFVTDFGANGELGDVVNWGGLLVITSTP